MFSDLKWIESKNKGGLTNVVKDLSYRLYKAHGAVNFSDENNIFEEQFDEKETVVKVIISSRVLETSVTVENVGFIVDFGEEKNHSFNNKIRVMEANV